MKTDLFTVNSQNFKAFIILEAKETKWHDTNFQHYQYSTSIPNGKQLKVGDLLLLAKIKKDIKTNKQIYAYCFAHEILNESSSNNSQIRKVIFTKINFLNNNYKYSDFIKSSGISRNSIKQVPLMDLINTLKIILHDQSN